MAVHMKLYCTRLLCPRGIQLHCILLDINMFRINSYYHTYWCNFRKLESLLNDHSEFEEENSCVTSPESESN